MQGRDVYYSFKGLIPRPVQIRLRQQVVRLQLVRHSGVWPILESAGRPPEGWTGWPEGKRFALVLTHDVEGPRGLEQCRRLMDVEERHGFRSSFNFIPAARYAVPSDLRDDMARRGFEVGVHGLLHDGRDFASYELFAARARKVNEHLKAWGAQGFRAASMIRRLDWIGDLDVAYDSSTFDTDPFEPQPTGVHTIFPFRVQTSGGRRRFVELPYTLPQDFTLFVLMKHRDTGIWDRKLDWIAARGGMALLDTHPDYMEDGGGRGPDRYPAAYYESFLRHVRERYEGQYWHALPREVAGFWRDRPGADTHAPPTRPKIWIDLDNTPHVPFFKPIVARLEARGCPVAITARDAFQVCELATQAHLPFTRVGRHHGKHKLVKLAGLFFRALQLAPTALRERPALALSHGSRSQFILANLLRIPSVLIVDYEHAQYPPLMRPDWRIVPEVIPAGAVACRPDRLLRYPGIKEDVYVPDFKPDPQLPGRLGLSEGDLVVTVRPPATEAHYHRPESDALFAATMERVCRAQGTRVVLLPRNKKQEAEVRALWPEWFASGRILVPPSAVDGLNLLWCSDLVISGGGTMNREAAALGVPVYSIFRGAIGAVDRHLAQEGRLVLIENKSDLDTKLSLVRRRRAPSRPPAGHATLDSIVDLILAVLDHETRGAVAGSPTGGGK